MLVFRKEGEFEPMSELALLSEIMWHAQPVERNWRRILLMALKRALFHPAPSGFLLATVLVAAAIVVVPGLDRYSSRLAWLMPLGGAAFLAAVIALRFGRPAITDPELRKLLAIRAAIAGRLRQSRASGRE